MTISVLAAHCTTTGRPSASTSSASPEKRPAASAAAHSSLVASGPPAMKAYTGCPITASRLRPSIVRKAGLESTIERCASVSTIALRERSNAVANSPDHPSCSGIVSASHRIGTAGSSPRTDEARSSRSGE